MRREGREERWERERGRKEKRERERGGGKKRTKKGYEDKCHATMV